MPRGIYDRKPRRNNRARRLEEEIRYSQTVSADVSERIPLDEHGVPIWDNEEPQPEPEPDEPLWGDIEVLPAEQAPAPPTKKGMYHELAEMLLEKLLDGADQRYVITVSMDSQERATRAAKAIGSMLAKRRGKGAVEVWTARNPNTGGWRLCLRRGEGWE